LPQRYIKPDDCEQRPEIPRPYPLEAWTKDGLSVTLTLSDCPAFGVDCFSLMSDVRVRPGVFCWQLEF